VKFLKVMSQTRATDADSLLKQIIIRYKQDDWSADAYLYGVFRTLEILAEIMVDAVNRIMAESNLEDKDENRDTSIRNFFAIIDGYCAFPDAIIKAAALDIKAILSNYGLEMVSKGYDTQTSLVDSLLNDLSQPEIVAKLEILAGTVIQIATITADQEAFILADVAFEDEKTKAGKKESATDIKKDIIATINGKLTPYLTVMSDVNEALYSDFATTVDHIIADSNEIVKKRYYKTNG
jgi:hypothetical protein